ncbi:hypothetical protein GY45DRAFT_1325101 [Cubamyces sp. BRFM 1775]|nr:hypothetical protein GY45DRAFT_1325101 [Cubamyces sp. BRFM 1775]
MVKRKHQDDASSSDDDAPEAFSFGTSKKAAKGEQEAVRQFHASQKLKQKEKNRAIDRKLKERATEGRGKGKAKEIGASHWEKATRGKGSAQQDSEDEDGSGAGEEDSGRDALEERMARAMREAEEEDSDIDEEGSAFGGLSGEEAAMDDQDIEEEDEEMIEGEEGEDGEDDEEDEEDFDEEEDEDEEMTSESEDEIEDDVEPTSSSRLSAKNRNYLPDHLFKSALSKAATQNTKIKFDEEESAPARAPASPPRKRRRAKRAEKDIVLGSRAIRTLPNASNAISPAAAKGLPPPRRVEKFVKYSLNLKADLNKSKTKGWTRRAANLGVMKRTGPAANFVRSS